MAIRIISLKKSNPPGKNPYLAIDSFEWVNERVNINGITERAKLYDWLKDSRGEAYIINNSGDKFYLMPAISVDGKKYVKTNMSAKKQDVLFHLPEST